VYSAPPLVSTPAPSFVVFIWASRRCPTIDVDPNRIPSLGMPTFQPQLAGARPPPSSDFLLPITCSARERRALLASFAFSSTYASRERAPLSTLRGPPPFAEPPPNDLRTARMHPPIQPTGGGVRETNPLSVTPPPLVDPRPPLHMMCAGLFSVFSLPALTHISPARGRRPQSSPHTVSFSSPYTHHPCCAPGFGEKQPERNAR
jgi:hypothetical protein